MKVFSAVCAAFITSLAVFFAWRHFHSPPSPLKYEDLSSKDPMENLARITGGQVTRLDKKSVAADGGAAMFAGMQAQLKERDYALLWTAEGMPVQQEISFDIWVDPSIQVLAGSVTSLSGMPEVALIGPGGGKASPEVASIGTSGIHFRLPSPKPGKWQVKVASPANCSIQVKAQSTSDLLDIQPRIVRPGGRPGHGGYFPYEGPFVPDAREYVELPLMNHPADAISELTVRLVSRSGQILESADLSRSNSEWAEPLVRVKLPGEPFRILAVAKLKNGEQVWRMFGFLFELNKMPQIEFKATLDGVSPEACAEVTAGTAWRILANPDKNSPSSASLGCVKIKDNGSENIQLAFSIRAPVSADGSRVTTTLYSLDYASLSASDCENAEKAFKQFPDVLTDVWDRKAAWSFRCEQRDGGGYRAVMSVDTSAQ